MLTPDVIKKLQASTVAVLGLGGRGGEGGGQRGKTRTKNIRNICILAHIDHGKTTLSDYLVSSNGIISSRLAVYMLHNTHRPFICCCTSTATTAGKIRYLDSRDDEQERGITMKSSSIALLYKHAHGTGSSDKQSSSTPSSQSHSNNKNVSQQSDDSSNKDGVSVKKKRQKKKKEGDKGEGGRGWAAEKKKKGRKVKKTRDAGSKIKIGKRGPDGIYMVNLIDSPGHIDFCSEVSTAVRFSDGGIVLVDAVEGVCSQTRTVLAQAWSERLKCCLVINKIDKLVTELKYQPSEIYAHCNRIIEQGRVGTNIDYSNINSNEMVNAVCSSFASAEAMERAAKEKKGQASYENIEMMMFTPEMGNVAFASAYDTWGFTLLDAAEFYSERLQVKKSILMRTLWGEYYYSKQKRTPMRKLTKNTSKELMAIEFLFNPICDVYGLEELKSKDTLEQYITDFNIKVPPRELVGREWRDKIRAVLGRWLPIAKSVLGMAVDLLPNPSRSQLSKIPRIWTLPKKLQLRSNAAAAAAEIDGDSKSGGEADGTSQEKNKEKASSSPLPHPSSPPSSEQQQQQQQSSSRSSPSLSWSSSSSVYAAVRDASLSCDIDSQHLLIYVAKMLDVGEKTISEALRRYSEHGDGAHTQEGAKPTFVRKKAGEGDDDEKQQQQQQQQNKDERRAETDGAASAREGGDNARKKAHVLMCDDNRRMEWAAICVVLVGRFLAFARVLSGTLRTDREQKIYVLKPGYNPANPTAMNKRYLGVTSSTSLSLFLLMGKSLQAIPAVPAGCIVGIGGLDDYVLNSGTISSTMAVPGLSSLSHSQTPIVKVALTPNRYPDMAALLEGLRLLQQADPNVEVGVTKSGQHVIVTSGELHLERCLRDLNTRFATGIKFQDEINGLMLNLPLVPRNRGVLNEGGEKDVDIKPLSRIDQEDAYRENQSKKQERKKRLRDYVEKATPDAKFKIRARAIPLVEKATKNAIERAQEARRLAAGGESREDGGGEGERGGGREIVAKALKDEDTRKDKNSSFWLSFDTKNIIALASLINSIRTSFQMVMEKGPLCEEPMTGVAVLIDSVSLSWGGGEGDNKEGEESLRARKEYVSSSSSPPSSAAMWRRTVASGMVIQTVREAFREAINLREARLVEPMYLVDLQVLRRLYAVIGKRRGRIISEDLKEGTQIFVVRCYLPVEKSFGFASSLRGRTSGMASPQLVFSHWETILEDPFFVPLTEEEKEEFGEGANLRVHNLARQLVDEVRRRKGLKVEEHIVEHAEKQRTLARKK
eukprot:jgi/Bigna1/66383/fgenesh1_pg.1_\